jgi:hypothetical protein
MTKTLYALLLFTLAGYAQEKKPQLIDYQPCRQTAKNHCKINEFKISWNLNSVPNAAGAIITRELDGKTKKLGTFIRKTGSVNDSICDTFTYHVVAIDRKRHKIANATDEITITRSSILECK